MPLWTPHKAPLPITHSIFPRKILLSKDTEITCSAESIQLWSLAYLNPPQPTGSCESKKGLPRGTQLTWLQQFCSTAFPVFLCMPLTHSKHEWSFECADKHFSFSFVLFYFRRTSSQWPGTDLCATPKTYKHSRVDIKYVWQHQSCSDPVFAQSACKGFVPNLYQVVRPSNSKTLDSTTFSINRNSHPVSSQDQNKVVFFTFGHCEGFLYLLGIFCSLIFILRTSEHFKRKDGQLSQWRQFFKQTCLPYQLQGAVLMNPLNCQGKILKCSTKGIFGKLVCVCDQSWFFLLWTQWRKEILDQYVVWFINCK